MTKRAAKNFFFYSSAGARNKLLQSSQSERSWQCGRINQIEQTKISFAASKNLQFNWNSNEQEFFEGFQRSVSITPA